MQLFLWIVDGLVAGWLTGKIMSGEGRDLLMDAIMGVAGGVAGGFMVNVAGLPVQGKMIYTNLVAIIGAVILTALSRVATGRRDTLSLKPRPQASLSSVVGPRGDSAKT